MTTPYGAQVIAAADRPAPEGHVDGVPLDQVMTQKYNEENKEALQRKYLTSKEQAAAVIQGLANGQVNQELGKELLTEYSLEFPEDWAQVQSWWNNKRAAERKAAEVQETPPEPMTYGEAMRNPMNPKELWESGKGALDLVKTMAASAVQESVVGVLSLGTFGEDVWDWWGGEEFDFQEAMDEAANFQEAIRSNEYVQKIVQPWSDRGQVFMEGIAGPLMALDDTVRDGAEVYAAKHGLGPETSAFLYTLIMGGADVVTLGKLRSMTPKTAAALLKENRKKVKQTAKELGVSTKQGDMVESIMEAAVKNSRGGRGAGMPALREAIVEARDAALKGRNEAEATARAMHAAVKAEDVASFGKSLEEMLRVAGYDINEMKGVGAVLQALKEIDKKSPLQSKPRAKVDDILQGADDVGLVLPERFRTSVTKEAATQAANRMAQLDELWTIRNRAEKAMSNPKAFENLPYSQNANEALTVIQKSLDDYMDTLITRNLMEGSPEAVTAWRAAHAIRQDFNRRFNHDKFIHKLVNENDASAAQLRNALFGRSLTGPKDSAVQTLTRMKRLLGNEHPAIKGLTLDYVHELVQPLIQEGGPNFNQFVRNYDKLVSNDIELVKALDLDTGKLAELREFAHVANRLPPRSAQLLTREFMATVIARYTFGHGIAKAGMTVALWKRALSAAFGKDMISQKQILTELANLRYGEPVVKKGDIYSMRVAQAAVMADWAELNRRKK